MTAAMPMQLRPTPGHRIRIILAAFLVLSVLLPIDAMITARPALAATPGEIFITSFSGDRVVRVDPNTGAQTVVTQGGDINGPIGIAIASNGDLIVVSRFCCTGGSGGVIRVNPNTGAQTIVSQGGNFVTPSGIAIDGSGNFIVLDENCCGGNKGAAIRVDPKSGAQTIISSGGNFVDPFGVTVGPTGDLFVADFTGSNGQGAVIRVNPNSGAQKVVTSGGNLLDPDQALVAVVGDEFFLIDQGCGAGNLGCLLRVSSTTGAQTIVSQGGNFVNPTGIALGPNGDVFVAEQSGAGGGSVIRVNPSTGAQSVVTSGGNVASAVGIAIAPVITIADASAPEGESLHFTVSLSPVSTQTVTVQFATSDGTATVADGDYQPRTGTLTFAPYETSTSIGVGTISDGKAEGSETIRVTLSNPTAANLARTQATGTILDGAPNAQVNDPNNDDHEDESVKGKKETEDQQRQRERTNRSGRSDVRTEGNVLAVEQAADGTYLLVTIGLTRNETGVVQAFCSGVPGALTCPDIKVGDYLEADGYQNGVGDPNTWFVASDGIEVIRNGKHVK